MVNVLVVERDMEYCKELINGMILINNNLKLCGISNNLEDMLFIIKRVQIDLIIIDVEKEDYQRICEDKILEKYKAKMILLARKEIFSKTKKDLCEFDYIIKGNDINEVLNSINLMILSKEFDLVSNRNNMESKIKNKIKKELDYLGFNFEYVGSIYLIETIYILYVLKDYTENNMKRDIYPIIAKKYGKTVNNIKCNIRNATDWMYFDNEEEKIIKYTRDYIDMKPKPKSVIAAVLEKIKD